jgi:hypothetical protein
LGPIIIAATGSVALFFYPDIFLKLASLAVSQAGM